MQLQLVGVHGPWRYECYYQYRWYLRPDISFFLGGGGLFPVRSLPDCDNRRGEIAYFLLQYSPWIFHECSTSSSLPGFFMSGALFGQFWSNPQNFFFARVSPRASPARRSQNARYELLSMKGRDSGPQTDRLSLSDVDLFPFSRVHYKWYT